MANSYAVTLDVNKSKYTINTPVTLREGDGGTANIVATINDNGFAYSGMTKASFFAQKPDGTVVATDPATVSGNTIRYTINKNLTNTSGHIVKAYFLINDSVSTENFTINIQEGLVLHGPSTDYIPGLNSLTTVWKATIKTWEDKFNDLKVQIENTDYSKVIKDTMTAALDEAKAQYQKDFNAAIADVNATVKELKDKGVEADQQIAVLKGKQQQAQTVADSLQATVDSLNKKILDIDKWLDSLHAEFTAKNETYMKAMQAELTKKLADMKSTSDTALATVKNNIANAQTDINDVDKHIADLQTTLKNVSDSVASINIPQIKADVDTANTNAQLALQQVENKAEKSDLIQLATDLVNDNLVTVYSNGTSPTVTKLNAPVLSLTPSDKQVSVKITDLNTAGVYGYEIDYSSNGTNWSMKTVIDKTAVITGLTNDTIYQFKVKTLADGDSYTDSDFSGIAKATPSGNPAVKLKTPTLSVSVEDATISYTITDTNTTGVKNYIISGVGSERTVTSKTGSFTATPSATYQVAVKAVSSDITKYTDSDFSTAVKAQLYTPNPVEKDFTVTVTDTTAVVTDNGNTIDRANEMLIISKSGGGVVATGKQGVKNVTLTGLTAGTKYASGSFWLGYKGIDGVESGKIAVPEFTTSDSGTVTPPVDNDTVTIDFSKKKQGDGLPYKAYALDAKAESLLSLTTTPKTELTDSQYQEMGKLANKSYSYVKTPSWSTTEHPFATLVKIDVQSFPVNFRAKIYTLNQNYGDRYGSMVADNCSIGSGVYILEKNGAIPQQNNDYSKYDNNPQLLDINLNVNSNDNKYIIDNAIWIVLTLRMPLDKTFKVNWDNTATITYGSTEQTNALTESLDSLETVDDSIMPTTYSMAPMMLSAAVSNTTVSDTIQKRLSENFVKRPELNSYVPLATMADYMTATDITNKYIPRDDVEKNYISKTDVANDYIKKSELNSMVDLSKYTTTVDMNKAISTAVSNAVAGLAKTSDLTPFLKNADVNSLITTALKDYLKKADLKQANYDAGFHSDWFGTSGDYTALSRHDGNVNYHTKEE